MSKKESNNDKKKSNFFKELKAELKKVTWPSFKKLVNNTGAVISIVLILAVIVFILDVCFENLNEFGVEGLKSLVSSTEETTEDETTDEDATSDEVTEEDTTSDEVTEEESTDDLSEVVEEVVEEVSEETTETTDADESETVEETTSETEDNSEEVTE